MKLLSKEQQRSVEVAFDTTVHSLFVTGEGGTGKSEIIRQLKEKLHPSTYVLLAPTQAAAYNIGGKTIHSFFKIKPTINIDVDKEEDVIGFFLDEIDPNIANGKIIIIDEASMLGEEMLHGILSRITPTKLILFGDPSQLDPVKDRPVDWSNFCQKTVMLTHNYRVLNDKLRSIITHYRETGKLLNTVQKIAHVREVPFTEDTVYMAHTNKVLSKMQKDVLGYSHARFGDILLTFGACDDSIMRLITVDGKKIAVPYYNNNDLVVVKSVPTLVDKGLWRCEIVRHDDYVNGTSSILENKYNKVPSVIVGDYDVYKSHLSGRFKIAQCLQRKLQKKYEVHNNAALKVKMSPDEADELRLAWREYFALKNSPYARHSQFRTTYKAQGQSFDKVVVQWDDLPNKAHRYVAMSRAMNKLTLILD